MIVAFLAFALVLVITFRCSRVFGLMVSFAQALSHEIITAITQVPAPSRIILTLAQVNTGSGVCFFA